MAQKQIVEVGAQHHPVVNFQGHILYRDIPAPESSGFIVWRENWSLPPIVVDGGIPIGPPLVIFGDSDRDALYSALTESGAYYLNNIAFGSASPRVGRGSQGLFVRLVGSPLPPGGAATELGFARREASMGRRQHFAAVDGSDWRLPTMAWSEYRMGQWDVVVVREGVGRIFDSGHDDLQPTLVNSGTHAFVAWTTRNNLVDLGAGRYGVKVILHDGLVSYPIFEKEGAIHPRFAKSLGGDPPVLVFEKDEGWLEFVLFDPNGVVVQEERLYLGCSTPRRPVATWHAGSLYVLYACHDLGGPNTELRLFRPDGACDVAVDLLDNIPLDRLQADYDIAGEHIVYSRYVGPEFVDFDLFYTDVSSHCP